MAHLTESEKERIIDQALPALRKAMKKAMGDSGWGRATIEFKRHVPSVSCSNDDRTMVNGVPVDDAD